MGRKSRKRHSPARSIRLAKTGTHTNIHPTAPQPANTPVHGGPPVVLQCCCLLAHALDAPRVVERLDNLRLVRFEMLPFPLLLLRVRVILKKEMSGRNEKEGVSCIVVIARKRAILKI